MNFTQENTQVNFTATVNKDQESNLFFVQSKKESDDE